VTVAVYPGTFDPITNGHLDIATRAAKLFDKVIIGVYETPSKDVLFAVEERVDLIRQAIADSQSSNLEVASFSGLIVDFVKEAGAQAIVRGLRVGADFEREFEMALMNKKLSPDCEVVCLMTNLKYQFLSSSLLKEVAGLGGQIDSLVPKPVTIALERRFIARHKTI